MPTLPPMADPGQQEIHLYYVTTDAIPNHPNYIPFKGWQVAAGERPPPRFRRVEVSKNSESVMLMVMRKLQKGAESDKRYSKTDLLAARIYFQDMPDFCKTGDYPKDLFELGAGSSNCGFKLLDEE